MKTPQVSIRNASSKEVKKKTQEAPLDFFLTLNEIIWLLILNLFLFNIGVYTCKNCKRFLYKSWKFQKHLVDHTGLSSINAMFAEISLIIFEIAEIICQIILYLLSIVVKSFLTLVMSEHTRRIICKMFDLFSPCEFCANYCNTRKLV